MREHSFGKAGRWRTRYCNLANPWCARLLQQGVTQVQGGSLRLECLRAHS